MHSQSSSRFGLRNTIRVLRGDWRLQPVRDLWLGHSPYWVADPPNAAQLSPRVEWFWTGVFLGKPRETPRCERGNHRRRVPADALPDWWRSEHRWPWLHGRLSSAPVDENSLVFAIHDNQSYAKPCIMSPNPVFGLPRKRSGPAFAAHRDDLVIAPSKLTR